jgi:hypothetical protein
VGGVSEEFQPSEEMRGWLDSLPPKQRHQTLDLLHGHYAASMRAAEQLDQVVDQLVPCQAGDKEKTSHHLTGFALFAESLRAGARCDWATARELSDAGTEHLQLAGEITIKVVDKRADEPDK